MKQPRGEFPQHHHVFERKGSVCGSERTGAVPLLDSTTSAVKTEEITGTPELTLAVGAAVASIGAARSRTEYMVVM